MGPNNVISANRGIAKSEGKEASKVRHKVGYSVSTSYAQLFHTHNTLVLALDSRRHIMAQTGENRVSTTEISQIESKSCVLHVVRVDSC